MPLCTPCWQQPAPPTHTPVLRSCAGTVNLTAQCCCCRCCHSAVSGNTLEALAAYHPAHLLSRVCTTNLPALRLSVGLASSSYTSCSCLRWPSWKPAYLPSACLHTAQHSTAQHSTAQHSTAQHSTAQHSTAQHSTAQHSTAQHSTAAHRTQHSAAQHNQATCTEALPNRLA
jgi:hypothetical protein